MVTEESFTFYGPASFFVSSRLKNGGSKVTKDEEGKINPTVHNELHSANVSGAISYQPILKKSVHYVG